MIFLNRVCLAGVCISVCKCASQVWVVFRGLITHLVGDISSRYKSQWLSVVSILTANAKWPLLVVYFYKISCWPKTWPLFVCYFVSLQLEVALYQENESWQHCRSKWSLSKLTIVCWPMLGEITTNVINYCRYMFWSNDYYFWILWYYKKHSALCMLLYVMLDRKSKYSQILNECDRKAHIFFISSHILTHKH